MTEDTSGEKKHRWAESNYTRGHRTWRKVRQEVTEHKTNTKKRVRRCTETRLGDIKQGAKINT